VGGVGCVARGGGGWVGGGGWWFLWFVLFFGFCLGGGGGGGARVCVGWSCLDRRGWLAGRGVVSGAQRMCEVLSRGAGRKERGHVLDQRKREQTQKTAAAAAATEKRVFPSFAISSSSSHQQVGKLAVDVAAHGHGRGHGLHVGLAAEDLFGAVAQRLDVRLGQGLCAGGGGGGGGGGGDCFLFCWFRRRWFSGAAVFSGEGDARGRREIGNRGVGAAAAHAVTQLVSGREGERGRWDGRRRRGPPVGRPTRAPIGGPPPLSPPPLAAKPPDRNAPGTSAAARSARPAH